VTQRFMLNSLGTYDTAGRERGSHPHVPCVTGVEASTFILQLTRGEVQ